MGYMGNFIVYFFAMIGIIILALFVYKKFNMSAIGFKRNNMLSVEDTLSLSPRKTLYVIRNGKERFLIAGDMERTTLISRLEDSLEEVGYSQPPAYSNPARTVRKADLSDENIQRQDNIAPMRRPIMKEIKNRLNF